MFSCMIFTTVLMSIITICPFLLVKSWDAIFFHAALSEAAAAVSKQDFRLLSFSSLSTVLHVPCRLPLFFSFVRHSCDCIVQICPLVYSSEWWRNNADVVVIMKDVWSDSQKTRGSVVWGKVGLCIPVLFPQTRKFTPHCLSSPRCIR